MSYSRCNDIVRQTACKAVKLNSYLWPLNPTSSSLIVSKHVS